MEHPVFSLMTKPDMTVRNYQNGDKFLRASPSAKGLATVHDRDILIYCISQCVAARNEGKEPSAKLKINAYEMLKATNRQTSGRGYDLLEDTLRRLQGTQIETNIKQGSKARISGFSLIDRYDIVRETLDGRMLDLEITLSDWALSDHHWRPRLNETLKSSKMHTHAKPFRCCSARNIPTSVSIRH